MINNALTKAKELLNDKSLYIVGYAETKDYYIFTYEDLDGHSIFDNTMIQVDKITNKASYYIISQHLDELDKLKFKPIDAK